MAIIVIVFPIWFVEHRFHILLNTGELSLALIFPSNSVMHVVAIKCRGR